MNVAAFQPEIYEFSLSDLPSGIEGAFRILSMSPNALFLDGCGDHIRTGALNRFSFLSADPIDSLVVEDASSFDFSSLRNLIARYPSNLLPDLPPFQGGVAGVFGYEFNSAVENVPPADIDEFAVPLVSLFVYDVVIAIDHEQQLAWIISQGWNDDVASRQGVAKERLAQFKSQLFDQSPPTSQPLAVKGRIKPKSQLHPIEGDLELYSDFSRDQFLQMIGAAIDYIRAGDIFQVNLSQRLLTPATKSSPDLYVDMRTINPAPFSGYLDFGDGQLISASPERLIRCHDRMIETRPIKGTRKRTHYPEVDLNVQNELSNSAKDRAENIMIVDLMRNDLSLVSDLDSVRVTKLCGIEQYQNVLHLVSVIESRLSDECDSVDLMRAVFPGGSITGAPKIRAMEIVSELEPTARGPYCGSLGYFNFNGDIDFNILIRSVTAKDGWWQVPVGGGIVSDSIPRKEYEETWTKAIGMLRAIKHAAQDRNLPDCKSDQEVIAAQ